MYVVLNYGMHEAEVLYRPCALLQSQQFATRLSARREQGSRVRRARPGDCQASSHEHLGLFQKQLESPSSPPGENLTTGDIIEDEQLYDEQGERFDEGEDVEERPLRGTELGVDRRISRQVSITHWVDRQNQSKRCVRLCLFVVAGDVTPLNCGHPEQDSSQPFRSLRGFE